MHKMKELKVEDPTGATGYNREDGRATHVRSKNSTSTAKRIQIRHSC